MKDNLKTVLFVLTAFAMLGMAGWAYTNSKPVKIDDFELVGQPFFEGFNGAATAKSLEVSAVNPDTATVEQFKVEEDDGLWRIPSHHNYPAEAADRLAATATSVIGLTRDSLVGRIKGDHERFGVMDPLDEEARDPEFTGQRISIKDDAGDIMVDLIVGKQADEVIQNPSGSFDQTGGSKKVYYVRRPDENQTYKVELDIDLSTRFADWIRPDLLQIEPTEVRKLSIDNYEMKEERASPLSAPQLFKMQGEKMDFSRDGDIGPWIMTGMNEQTETLDNARVNQLVTGLDELQIVGVRPKTLFDGSQVLTPNLTLNKDVIQRFKSNSKELQALINQVQFELQEYGFNLAPAAGGGQELMLVSENGEMSVGTDKGVVYSLQFGKPVSGQDQAIEIGGASADVSGIVAEEPTSETDTDPTPTPTDRDAEQTPAEPMKNRFLMIRVNFDEALIAGKPVKPTAPTAPAKPEGYVPANKDSKTDQPPLPEGAKANQQDADADQKTKAEQDDRDSSFKQYDQLLKVYEEQTAIYELGLTRFEDEEIAFQQKVKEGEKRVTALNERFGPWFYVISGNNLEALQVDRQQLIQSLPSSPDSPLAPLNQLPPRPNINFGPTGGPGLENQSPAATVPEKKPAVAVPDSTQPEENEAKDGAKQSDKG